MIVDDDPLTREVLTVLAEEAGHAVEAYDSGQAALEALAAGDTANADAALAVLVDMQMPGVSGDTLARLLRAACTPGKVPLLVAMSGSAVAEELLGAFDGFVLKPFSMDQLGAVLEAAATGERAAGAWSAGQRAGGAAVEDLNAHTFGVLAESMPPDQLRRLYAMSLDDADRRIERMRLALTKRDIVEWRAGAHTIKGGCGFVGAVELARLAEAMETSELPDVDDEAPFRQFLAASARLRRMLDARMT